MLDDGATTRKVHNSHKYDAAIMHLTVTSMSQGSWKEQRDIRKNTKVVHLEC